MSDFSSRTRVPKAMGGHGQVLKESDDQEFYTHLNYPEFRQIKMFSGSELTRLKVWMKMRVNQKFYIQLNYPSKINKDINIFPHKQTTTKEN